MVVGSVAAPWAEVLADVAGHGQGVKILVTSRALLDLRLEHVYQVPPLTLPEELSGPPERPLDYEAVRLFVERAQAVGSVHRIIAAADLRPELIAAAYEPPLAFVRSLVRAGAHDVVPLPLDPEELETALDPIRRSRTSNCCPS